MPLWPGNKPQVKQKPNQDTRRNMDVDIEKTMAIVLTIFDIGGNSGYNNASDNMVTTKMLMIILLTMVMTRVTTGHNSNRGQIRAPSWNIEIHNTPLLSNFLKGFRNFLEIFPMKK